MRAQISVFFVFMFLAFSSQFSASQAEAVSSKELIYNADSYNEKIVTFRGEAVVAVLNRGEYSWVNLNDGNNAIGLWCKSDLLSCLRFVGDYKNRGDILEAEGVFHRACHRHGGELDIHAYNVKVVKSGFKFDERLDGRRLHVSALVFLIILSFVVIFRKRF